jgi:hypothetical protein
MLLKTTKHLMKKYICVYFFSKQGILRNHGVFFLIKNQNSKQNSVPKQAIICSLSYSHNSTDKTHQVTNYTANTEHQVFIESKHSFSIPVYFWPTVSHFYAYTSHRWNIHIKLKKKRWATGWWPNLICMRLLFVLLK